MVVNEFLELRRGKLLVHSGLETRAEITWSTF